jgi:hypothetical protein
MGQVSWWVELLRAMPSIVTAATAIVGVILAKAGLEKWRRETIGKRKVELAEEVLADIYQARDIIQAARSFANFNNEGSTRHKEEWETEDDTGTLNAYFAAIERLNNQSEFFAELYARRYRFIALFGRDAAKPYDDLFQIRNDIIIAARMLLRTHQRFKVQRPRRPRDEESLLKSREKWEKTIWWGLPEEDPIPSRLDCIVEAIEKTCRPAIQESAT